MIRAVLFDYGHTLVDLPGWDEYLVDLEAALDPLVREHLETVPERTLVSILRRVAEAYDGSYLRGELDEQVLAHLYRDAFAAAGVALSEAEIEALVDADHAVGGRMSLVGDGTPELLEALRRRGIKLGIVSNNIYRADKAQLLWPLLAATDARFSTIVFSSDVGRRKPDAVIYQAALRELAVDPAEVVFVGDRLREDVRGPRSQGIGRAYLTHQYRQEDDPQGEANAILTRLPELLTHLDA